jgi:hypothetical protein
MSLAEKQVSVTVSNDGPYIVSADAPLAEQVIVANAVANLCNGKEVIMSPRTFANVTAWFESVTMMGEPPKDPNYDDEEDEDDEQNGEDQEKEPAVIREPDE